MRLQLAIIFLLTSLLVHGQSRSQNDFLILIFDSAKNDYGYKNLKGDTLISLGKYPMCFTDTFRTYAIVLSKKGFIAIDRQEHFMYNVYPFDNGPDYIQEGLFRIVDRNKVGFANASNGEIVIKPQFDCAEPFENGKSKASYHCYKKYWVDSQTGKPDMNDPHFDYESDEWFYIDKAGNRITSPDK